MTLKSIVCALKNYNLNSREKFERGPGFDPEVQGSNPGPSSNFSLEFKYQSDGPRLNEASGNMFAGLYVPYWER